MTQCQNKVTQEDAIYVPDPPQRNFVSYQDQKCPCNTTIISVCWGGGLRLQLFEAGEKNWEVYDVGKSADS